MTPDTPPRARVWDGDQMYYPPELMLDEEGRVVGWHAFDGRAHEDEALLWSTGAEDADGHLIFQRDLIGPDTSQVYEVRWDPHLHAWSAHLAYDEGLDDVDAVDPYLLYRLLERFPVYVFGNALSHEAGDLPDPNFTNYPQSRYR